MEFKIIFLPAFDKIKVTVHNNYIHIDKKD